MAEFLAQVPDVPTPTTIMGAFITVAIGLLGLVVWMMRHVFLTTIPSIIASSETKFAGLLADQKEQRESHERTQAAATAAIVSLTNGLREERELIVAEIKANTKDEMSKYRHEQAETLNRAVLGRELYLLQKSREVDGGSSPIDLPPKG